MWLFTIQHGGKPETTVSTERGWIYQNLHTLRSYMHQVSLGPPLIIFPRQSLNVVLSHDTVRADKVYGFFHTNKDPLLQVTIKFP